MRALLLSTHGVLARASHVLLGLVSATVVWILCLTAPVLLGTAASIVPIVIAGIWVNIAQVPVDETTVDETTIQIGVVLFILLATVVLVRRISTAVLRLSLRLSPLPIGSAASPHVSPTLWFSWLVVLGALIASGSEWITLIVAAVVGLYGMGRAWHFRRHWKGVPNGRTVLFLRRFGKTADRLVSTAIRRAVPEGTCLAFLVGPRQGAASWDPLVVGFDGLGRHALPHYLKSTDREWVGHVRQMASHADAIVLDATDWSGAMDTELAIVDSCRAYDRLIILRRAGDAPADPLHERRALRYRASWRQAAHRMFGGFMLALLPAVVGESLGWSPESRFMSTLPAVVAWLCLAVRPLMDADAADDLARRLATLSVKPIGER